MTKNPKLSAILCLCLVFGGGLLPLGIAEASLWGYTHADATLGETSLGGDHSDMPPGWVMQHFDPTGMLAPASPDPSISLDPSSGHIRETYSEGGIETRPPMVTDLDQYSGLLTTRTYRRLWRDQARSSRSVARTGAIKRSGFNIDLPIQIPKQLRGILGSGAPNIDVSGSETITLSGVSDWTVRSNDQGLDRETKRPSAFPSLEMKQDLQVNLTGSIGDKIKVDVDQSSNVQTSLDNKVKLRYEGDEDDMIKSIDLGNTNLSLQGASIRQEGLFGVKTVAKLGNVDVVTIASKQEGKSETARFTPSGEKRRVIISDLDYVKRQYFFISDHAMEWVPASLKVYRDDRNGSNNTETHALPGIGRYDPTTASDSTNAQTDGAFDVLTQGIDYDVFKPYLLPSGEIPVLKMRYPLNPTDVLAVTYVEKVLGVDTNIGSAVGDTILLKVIKPSVGDVGVLEGGQFDPKDEWYPALAYELKNFYDLTARDISRETLDLKIRRRDAGQSVDPDRVKDKPLVEILGLDRHGNTVDSNPDGKVDDDFIIGEEGIIYFPDLHPFDPVCARFPRFRCQDDSNRNTLARDSLGNPNVYDNKLLDFATQSRYYIDAEFKSSQQGYFLGRFNILENSEQVKVDNILQKKGTDYSIDYDTGQLTFSRPPGPEQVISVDYSFAPGIGQVQRTLLGFSTSYSPSADLSVTSSMLYESRGAQELNPKLGEEPARSMVGDIASVLTFRPSWMTQLANVLPGVHTSAQSTLNLQGNVAVSMPNPNTKGEAYIDDMEGNRESNTVGLG